METPKILIVDDEQAILDMIVLVLHKEGFQDILTAKTGHEAVAKCQVHVPNVIVLDVMLPDLDGYEVCRQIRQISDAPILFLTAKSSDLDKLLGFGVGADDYITKPFNPLEIVARIKAHVRRQLVSLSSTNANAKSSSHSSPSKGDGIFDYGRFTVDERSATIAVEGEIIQCPAREFQLLLFLCKNPNRVFSREQLYEQVWGEQSVGADNTVMVHMRRLREKIEADASNPKYLSTVRGLGYKLTTGSQREDHS